MSVQTITIEVDQPTAQLLLALQTKAEMQGITLADLLRPLAENGIGRKEERPLYETATPAELAQAFWEWAESHDRSLPPLPLPSVSRESIYEDR